LVVRELLAKALKGGMHMLTNTTLQVVEVPRKQVLDQILAAIEVELVERV
jgi:hypothetical protein